MRLRGILLIAAAAAVLGGCAGVHEPGWTGSNATPFDSAKARCEIETQTTEGEAFERCMETHGWRRLP